MALSGAKLFVGQASHHYGGDYLRTRLEKPETSYIQSRQDT